MNFVTGDVTPRSPKRKNLLNSVYQLDVNKIAPGNIEGIRHWIRVTENAIKSEIPKSNNYDFRTLPFHWKIDCGTYMLPEDDVTMGIPVDLVQFDKFQKDGRYIGTAIENLQINDASKLTSVADSTITETVCKTEYMAYFGGDRFTGTWANFTKNENITSIRDALLAGIRIVLTYGPASLKNQLRRTAVKNWTHFKSLLFELRQCKQKCPSLVDARSIIRDLPRMNHLTIESRIIALRERMLPFFIDHEDGIKLSELASEEERFVGKDKYGPCFNMHIFMQLTQNISHAQFKAMLIELAKVTKKDFEKLEINDLLNNKKHIYEKINELNGAREHFQEDKWRAALYIDPENSVSKYMSETKSVARLGYDGKKIR